MGSHISTSPCRVAAAAHVLVLRTGFNDETVEALLRSRGVHGNARLASPRDKSRLEAGLRLAPRYIASTSGAKGNDEHELIHLVAGGRGGRSGSELRSARLASNSRSRSWTEWWGA